jgi:hypothetical protein
MSCSDLGNELCELSKLFRVEILATVAPTRLRTPVGNGYGRPAGPALIIR